MTIRTRTRPARHGLATVILKCVRGSLRVLPKPWIRALGTGFGHLAHAVSYRQNQKLRSRLNLAGVHGLAVGQIWTSLGRRFFEFLCLERFIDDVVIDGSATTAFQAAQAEGKGVMVATAHLGNWELMAAALVAQGYDVVSVAGQPSPGPLSHALNQIRRAVGVKTLHRGAGARQAIRILGQGGAVGFFCDQRTQEKSSHMQFMGATAPTPLTFERVCKLTESQSIFLWNIYDGRGRYTVYGEPIPRGDEMTQWIQYRIENVIRRNPEQWVWLHNRWAQHGNSRTD